MRTSRRPQRSRPHKLLTSTCLIVLVWSEISGAGLLLLSPHEACNLQHSYAVRRAKKLISVDASHGLPHVRGGRPDKTDECDMIRGGHHIGPAPRDDRHPEELNPARFKLRESLDLLQEKGYELGAGGDIGLIALNEHLAGYVEPGVGVPDNFMQEWLGLESPDKDSEEEDGVRQEEDEVCALGTVHGNQIRASTEKIDSETNKTSKRQAREWRKARDALRRAEEDAEAMLGVGLMSDWKLLREAVQMIKPLTQRELFVDLGCGDGRVCIEAAQYLNCSALGIDIDIEAVEKGRYVVEALELQDKVHLRHDDLMDFDFSNASVVYVFLPIEMLVPTSPLYVRLYNFLRNGGLVITAYSILDYLSPASVCILDKTRQAYLYNNVSCAKPVLVTDPLAEFNQANARDAAPMVVPFGQRTDNKNANEEEAGVATYMEILNRYDTQ